MSSLAHVIEGSGTPTASHVSRNCSPTDAVLWPGPTMISGGAACKTICIRQNHRIIIL